MTKQQTITDTERMNWIEEQTNGTPWVCRMSALGRGFRLHNAGGDVGYEAIVRPTAREAIDVAIREGF